MEAGLEIYYISGCYRCDYVAYGNLEWRERINDKRIWILDSKCIVLLYFAGYLKTGKKDSQHGDSGDPDT